MLSLILSLQHNLVKTLSTLTTSGFLCEDKPIVERDYSLAVTPRGGQGGVAPPASTAGRRKKKEIQRKPPAAAGKLGFLSGCLTCSRGFSLLSVLRLKAAKKRGPLSSGQSIYRGG